MMLLYEELDAFMVRPQNLFEPVECFIKRHFPGSTDQIISVRNDLFFRRQRNIILFRKAQPLCFIRRDPCSDVPLNDIDECRGKPEGRCDLDARKRMLDAVSPRSSDIMEQPAKPYQVPIDLDRDPAGYRDRSVRDCDTVRNNVRRSPCFGQYGDVRIQHTR
jgi:hypothetical protein